MQLLLRSFARLAASLLRPFVAQATAREQVIEAIQHTLDNAQPQGMDAIVMFAEIDDFRFLNSSHEGAEVAEIIQIVERRLKGSLLARDMVRSLHAGQFAVLLSPLRCLSAAEVEGFAGKIQAAIRHPIPIGRKQVLLTRSISGFEALARWHHNVRGIISPAVFLPVLEEAGMMRKLSRVMLRDAMRALRDWDIAHLNVPQISVNMSTEELRNPDLPSEIHALLQRYNLTPDRLVLEVLETVTANRQDDPIILNLRELARLGCQIDLDDFGTGHTSIKSVRRFAVNRIKIDRSFVTGIDMDTEQQQLVQTVLSMAKSLTVDTLAEGIESQAEMTYLADVGCSHGQGYAIARPLQQMDATQWVKAQDKPPPPHQIHQTAV